MGFEVLGGDVSQNYLMMRNDAATQGLFQGRVNTNPLTLNPGWDNDANPLEAFTDLGTIQKHLKAEEIKLEREIDEESSAPAISSCLTRMAIRPWPINTSRL